MITRTALRARVGPAACVAVGMATAACGDADAPAAPAAPSGPRIVDVRYVDRHALGDAAARPALVVRARDPDGQIVAMEAHIGGVTQHADGACDLGGKRAGEVERWVLPVRALRPGRHRIRLTVESSPCDRGAGGGQAISRAVHVTAAEGGGRRGRGAVG